VEAAGVEPASEKARREKTTCVAALCLSACRLRTGEKTTAQPDWLSALQLRAEALGVSCEMTLTRYRTGPAPEAAT